MHWPRGGSRTFSRAGLALKQTGLYTFCMSRTEERVSKARQRLIETAERLFYAEGLQAVGIDRIIAEAGVAKMTLYKHFSSKDELILATLEYREKQVEDMFQQSIKASLRRGRSRLEGFFDALKAWFESEGFRGCSFINAALELAREEHPASRFAAAHKLRFYGRLRDVLVEAAGQRGEALAPAITLLVEGAIVTAVMQGTSKSADIARDTALALLS